MTAKSTFEKTAVIFAYIAHKDVLFFYPGVAPTEAEVVLLHYGEIL